MTLETLAAIGQIILIDIVLSGDNAVVIALAAHKLPAYQRKRAIMWGGGIAIFLRIVFTAIMAFLLMVPGVRLVGGMVLVWIACKLLLEEEEHEVTADDADRTALAAIRMIFVADFVMSLDNMLAVAGASHGDLKMLLMGLLVSIGIIMTCSNFIARLMSRFKWIVYLGAGILALTAGEMMLGDRELAGYIVRHHGISLNSHWEHDYMLSHADLKEAPAGEVPEELRGVARVENKKLIFTGQMDEAQHGALAALAANDADRKAIDAMYELSRKKEVPGWVPETLRGKVENWFQQKWPIEDCRRIEGNRHHYVAWIFYALVVTFCLSSPYWARRKAAHVDGASEPPAQS